jgi:multiple sugar transport system permease protein
MMKTGIHRLAEREARLAFCMLAPTVAVVLAFVIFPVLWNVWLSLKPVTLAGLRDGSLLDRHLTLNNFVKAFTDPEFGDVLWTTLVYTFSGSALSVVLGLVAALLVHGAFPGRSLLRGLFISPYIAPVVAVTFTWSFILDPQLGVLNRLAMEKDWVSEPIAFLSQHRLDARVFGLETDIPLALLTVILFEGWRYFPFAFLFVLARLQALPEELYKAAAVDGAGPFQRFYHITLPQLATVLSTLFLFRFIWTINKFDDIYLLTRGYAGTKVLTLKVYDYAFGEFDIGAGSALAMVLFAILTVFLFLYFRWAVRDQRP